MVQSEQPGRAVPLRNIWVLFLYAADLAKFKSKINVEAEEARDLPELIARVLVSVVKDRLRRNLSRGYLATDLVLTRVRGRIDLLNTSTKRLLERGRVACHFDEHTVNTPRNRMVRYALEYLSRAVPSKEVLRECGELSRTMERMGVKLVKPSRAEMVSDQIGRNESGDLLMASLAKMVFEAFIPNEQQGKSATLAFDTDEHLIRRLFEKAVTNALRIQLEPKGWQVRHGRKLSWPVIQISSDFENHLPGMETDIELVHVQLKRKLVIDTKFNQMFVDTRHRKDVLRNGYLYQLYTYLRTQESELFDQGYQSEGMLLHPQFGGQVDAFADIQGHRMRFRTVDLTTTSADFERQLLSII